MLVVLRFAPKGIPALMGGRRIGGGTGGGTDSDRPGKAGGGERGPGRAPGREKDGRWALRASSAGVWGRGSGRSVFRYRLRPSVVRMLV